MAHVEVTEEVRRAVYAADCEDFGHVWDMSNVLGGTDEANPKDPRGVPMTVLRARDPELMPHISCQRCGRVWLVIDEPGDTYDDAVQNVRKRIGAAKAGRDAFRPKKRRGIEVSFPGNEGQPRPPRPDRPERPERPRRPDESDNVIVPVEQ